MGSFNMSTDYRHRTDLQALFLGAVFVRQKMGEKLRNTRDIIPKKALVPQVVY